MEGQGLQIIKGKLCLVELLNPKSKPVIHLLHYCPFCGVRLSDDHEFAQGIDR